MCVPGLFCHKTGKENKLYLFRFENNIFDHAKYNEELEKKKGRSNYASKSFPEKENETGTFPHKSQTSIG